jgi:hypothetical protein
MSGQKVYTHDPGDRSVRITTGTTTAVKAGTGVLKRIIIGTTAAGTITVNDAIGAKLVLKASMPEGSYELNLLCVGKIEVVTGAASDITVSFE